MKEEIKKLVEGSILKNEQKKKEVDEANASKCLELRLRAESLNKDLDTTNRELCNAKCEGHLKYGVRAERIKYMFESYKSLIGEGGAVDIFSGFRDARCSDNEKEDISGFSYSFADPRYPQFHPGVEKMKPLPENDPAKRVLEIVLDWAKYGGPQPDYVTRLNYLGDIMQSRTMDLTTYQNILTLQHSAIKEAIKFGRAMRMNYCPNSGEKHQGNFEEFFIEDQKYCQIKYTLEELSDIAKEIAKQHNIPKLNEEKRTLNSFLNYFFTEAEK